MEEKIYYLTEADVELINAFVIQLYSPDEHSGVKDRSLLRSALGRPQQSVFGEDAYPSIHEKAAALFESIALNHAFHNANKRTAFTALVHFLSYNGWELIMDQDDAVTFTLDTVLKKLTFQEITNRIRSNSSVIKD